MLISCLSAPGEISDRQKGICQTMSYLTPYATGKLLKRFASLSGDGGWVGGWVCLWVGGRGMGWGWGGWSGVLGEGGGYYGK